MRKSEWHCLEDVAKNYNLGQEADLYRRLLADIRSGKFDEFGLRFLNPDPRDRRRLRVTRAMVENMVEIFGVDINETNPGVSPIVVQFLRHCWMPNTLYRRFYGGPVQPAACKQLEEEANIEEGAQRLDMSAPRSGSYDVKD